MKRFETREERIARERAAVAEATLAEAQSSIVEITITATCRVCKEKIVETFKRVHLRRFEFRVKQDARQHLPRQFTGGITCRTTVDLINK